MDEKENKEMSLDELCQQSIQTYLDMQGIPYSRNGNYLKLKDHDSLVVDTRIMANKPYETFYWNSEGIGGNLYNFLVAYEGLDKHQAISRLKELSPKMKFVPKHVVKEKVYHPENYVGVSKPYQVQHYLIHVRKLHESLVKQLLDHQLIRQLKNGNTYFSWRDSSGKEVGGDEQGTRINHQKYGKRGTLKKIAPGSKKGLGFHFNNINQQDPEKTKLYVFESPIDALSYYQMHGVQQSGRKSFLSLNGAGSKVNTIIYFMRDFMRNPQDEHHIKVDEVHLALDTDRAGIEGTKKAQELIDKLGMWFGYPKVVVDQPGPGVKDWNEALQKGDRTLKQLDWKNFAIDNKIDDKEKDNLGQKPISKPKSAPSYNYYRSNAPKRNR